MINLRFNQLRSRIIFSWILLLSIGYSIPAVAEKTNPQKDEKIHISAENLVVDSETRYAEFSGKVKAVQGKTEISSDTLRIYYKADSKTSNPSGSEDMIEKIVAQGNVVIRFDDKIAETSEAVYNAADRTLVLSGENSKVTSGKDFITGSKIIVNRNDGRIRVEGNSQKPVEAILFPGEKGIE